MALDNPTPNLHSGCAVWREDMDSNTRNALMKAQAAIAKALADDEVLPVSAEKAIADVPEGVAFRRGFKSENWIGKVIAEKCGLHPNLERRLIDAIVDDAVERGLLRATTQRRRNGVHAAVVFKPGQAS
jgi:hypothetical protein